MTINSLGNNLEAKPLDNQRTVATPPANSDNEIGQANSLPSSSQVSFSDAARELNKIEKSLLDSYTKEIEVLNGLQNTLKKEWDICMNLDPAKSWNTGKQFISKFKLFEDKIPKVIEAKASQTEALRELNKEQDALRAQLGLSEETNTFQALAHSPELVETLATKLQLRGQIDSHNEKWSRFGEVIGQLSAHYEHQIAQQSLGVVVNPNDAVFDELGIEYVVAKEKK